MNAMPLSPLTEPAACIDPELTETIRRFSSESEKSGQLHSGQLVLIYQQRWFKIFVPREFGGLELELPEGLRLLEALAWADGSLGWVVTLCGGANWFIGFLPRTLAATLFADERVCLAGSGKASGMAAETGDGYNVNGHWKYATGAPHATAFTANCLITRDGGVQTGADGHPQAAAFLFLQSEVQVHQDWQSMGMIATASRSFSVSHLQLPAERRFHIGEQYAVLPQPVYRYPFLLFAMTTLSVNIAGMATRFLELCRRLLEDRLNRSPDTSGVYAAALVKLRSAETAFAAVRYSFYQAVERSCDHSNTGAIPPADQQGVIAACRQLTTVSRKRAHEFFPFCGMPAANPGTEINRVWRNLQTACLHVLLVDGDCYIPGE